MEIRKDCFAYHNYTCKALKYRNCRGCKFYRTDIDFEKIENDIRRYSNESVQIQR